MTLGNAALAHQADAHPALNLDSTQREAAVHRGESRPRSLASALRLRILLGDEDSQFRFERAVEVLLVARACVQQERMHASEGRVRVRVRRV